jgi:O-succinylbenzoate synthase
MTKLTATFKKHTLQFKFPATTSRGTITEKETWFIRISNTDNPAIFGIGECGPLAGLSIDPLDNFELELANVCQMINAAGEIPAELELDRFPSIEFGLETALLDLENGGIRKITETSFFAGEEGIPINGLVWMADKAQMQEQVKQKIKQGFNCLKLKVGAIDFADELSLLEEIRKEFLPEDLEIRVDANGAFSPETVLEKLDKLAKLKIHSVEQPIKAGQWAEMAKVCKNAPLPVALDEELIGIQSESGKKLLLQVIKPQYLIIKPTLNGGFQSAQEWIELAHKMNIGWWATSALESNIGLNAISQWTSSLDTKMYQGLGTGQLYTNNIPSPLEIKQGNLYCNNDLKWDLSLLGW